MKPEEQRSVELMRALMGGEDGALRELFVLWEPPLLRFAYRYLQNETEARDLVQDVFIRLHASLGRYDPARPFAPWIYTIATNLCHNRRRWRQRHPLLSLDWLLGESPNRESMICPRPGPARAAEDSERVLEIRAAIGELPHEMKTTLLLHEYEGLGYREIAEIVGCSEKGVESRLSRTRKRLRTRLAGLMPSAATCAAEAV